MADYKNIIGFTEVMEGGKSSDQNDSARKNPSPCGTGKNGFPIHTNKGVQWITFKTLASSLGYEPSCANFLSMPKDIWLKIFKKGYWDPMKGDDIKNQAIANIFVKWAWGSGVQGATNSLKKFFKENYNIELSNVNEIKEYVNKIGEDGNNYSLFIKLMAHRKQFLLDIPGTANDKGWFIRESEFYTMNLPYVISTKVKRTLLFGSISIIIAAGLFYYGRKLE